MGIKGKIVLSGLVFLFVGAILLPGYSRLERLREQNREYEMRIEHLLANNEELERELRRLEEDPEYIEVKARDKLGIVREGEVIYSPSRGR